MDLHNLKIAEGSRHLPKRVGQGIGSGMGKTSTRGQKGQGARQGRKVPVGFEGGQLPLYRRVPKHGFVNYGRVEYAVINLLDLEGFDDVVVRVTDGTLTIGIKKTSDTGIYNTAWCCFDNFQLFYLGTEDPSKSDINSKKYSDLDVLRTATISQDKTQMTLTGNWRVMDENEMKTVAGDNPLLLIDATNATLISKPTLPAADGTNVMLKVRNANLVANTANVLVGDKCSNFVLTDKKDFAPTQNFYTVRKPVTRTQVHRSLRCTSPVLSFSLRRSSTRSCFIIKQTDTLTRELIIQPSPRSRNV